LTPAQVKVQSPKSKVQSSFRHLAFPTAPRYGDGMESAILAKAALQLSPVEKAQMIDALWQSLDPAEQKSIDRAWLAESQDRLRAFRAGELKPLDGEKTLRSITSELGK
jgi:putative addiction module component (TIGR02574 family)